MSLGLVLISADLLICGGADAASRALARREQRRDLVANLFLGVDECSVSVRVAVEGGVDEHWLNDGVKGYLSERGSFSEHLELSNLKVFCADANYLLAMKCVAMRIGEEFQDLDDIRYLLRHIGIRNYDAALKVITKYYPLERFPQKTLYALEELLENDSSHAQ